MIVEYHRPSTIAQALELLSRLDPKTYPLGGGSWLSRQKGEDFAVVDTQKLDLDEIEVQSDRLILGAAVRLQKLVEALNAPTWLKSVCLRETGRNLREMSTLAGTLIGANGRSPLAIAMLAADSQVLALPGDDEIPFERFLSIRKQARQPWLITRFTLDPIVDVKAEFIARSPVDIPIVGIAVARWSTGRICVAVGGFGDAPVLAYDGYEPNAAVAAVESTFAGSDDEWASADYRKAAAVTVAARLVNK